VRFLPCVSTAHGHRRTAVRLYLMSFVVLVPNQPHAQMSTTNFVAKRIRLVLIIALRDVNYV